MLDLYRRPFHLHLPCPAAADVALVHADDDRAENFKAPEQQRTLCGKAVSSHILSLCQTEDSLAITHATH